MLGQCDCCGWNGVGCTPEGASGSGGRGVRYIAFIVFSIWALIIDIRRRSLRRRLLPRSRFLLWDLFGLTA